MKLSSAFVVWRSARRAGAIVFSLLSFAIRVTATEDELKDLREVDEPPRLTAPLHVEYPYGMRAANLEGAVLLEFVINKKGEPVNVVGLKSNNRSFDRAALTAMQKARFKPARVAGKPVNARAQQMITFRLNDGARWMITKTSNHDTLPEQFRWDVAPEVNFSAFPVYPREALLAKRKGKAAIAFIIGPSGKVAAVRVLEATEPEMGHAAAAAVQLWDFKPARKKDGSACAATVRMDYEFEPNGNGNVPVTPGAEAILRLLRKSPNAILAASQLDAKPQPIVTDAPAYPLALAQAGRGGEAVIEFFIDENGDAQLPRVVSATDPEFGYAALQAVGTWRFTPPLAKGRPVVTRASMPLHFKATEISARAAN